MTQGQEYTICTVPKWVSAVCIRTTQVSCFCSQRNTKHGHTWPRSERRPIWNVWKAWWGLMRSVGTRAGLMPLGKRGQWAPVILIPGNQPQTIIPIYPHNQVSIYLPDHIYVPRSGGRKSSQPEWHTETGHVLHLSQALGQEYLFQGLHGPSMATGHLLYPCLPNNTYVMVCMDPPCTKPVTTSISSSQSRVFLPRLSRISR